ncbi:MAG TPA: hypothetical protein VN841_17000 [Bryobacteraceae bacterium]|nr:hypothetical protein [Bryobacteraceae bacterium]HXR38145.1 hypothetical protein [Terracidiphilus sp.]
MTRLRLLLVSAIPLAAVAIWIANPLPARAQALPNLVVEALSVYATMPDASGERQVTASFQIVNQGAARAAASSTTVQSAGGSTILATPPLLPGATAFFSITTTTSATDFTITVTAGNNNTASYQFVAGVPAVGRWRPLGPSVIMATAGFPAGVGRITTIAVDPSSTSTLYAGARASGLWKTTDGGAHWEPLTDALPTVNINAVAVDPNSPAHVFIASPAGIFGSRDGGHVWTLLNGQDLKGLGNDGGAFIVESFRPTILAGTLAAPNDVGAATAAQPGLAAPGLLLPSPFNEVRLYLTTQNGLRISRDGGVTWLPPVLGAGATIQSLVQDRSFPNHLLATVDALPAPGVPGVYETFTGGLTPGSWQKLQGCPWAPLPTFPPTAAVWVAQSGATLWVGVKNGTQHQLWRSSGQPCFVIAGGSAGLGPAIGPILPLGRAWELLSSGDQTPCIGPVSEWSYLKADPTNPSLLYKGGVRLCRSTDGGATFQAVRGLHDDHHALVFHPIAPGVLFEGNDGGLYRSNDGGQSWAFNAEGLSVTEFLALDYGGALPRFLVGGSQDNATSSSDLSTPVWYALDDGNGDTAIAVVDPLDPTVQYTMGQAVNHISRIQNGIRDGSPLWQWEVGDNPTGVDPYNGLPEGCLTYSEWLPALYTEFIATTNTAWHLLTTVGASGPNCNGGLWTGPPWYPLFAPADGEVLRRVAYDSSIGLFLAGGNLGSVYINFSPDAMAKVWSALAGSVTAIVPDVARTASYFVALNTPANAGAGTPANAGAGRIFEINPVAQNGGITIEPPVVHWDGQDITANLPPALVMTLASNPFEPDVLYAGTQGQGVFRGVRDATGQWSWQSFNNGMPPGAFVTKLRVNPADGTIYAATYGRGAFALDTVSIVIY